VARYQLFVDDSGSRDYDDNRVYGLVGKSLHFVYGAILIEQNAGAQFVPQLRNLKQVTFGSPDVEVKSNWLRMPEERRRHYLDPFGVTEEQVARFTDNYYQLLIQASLQLIGVVVNKRHMQEKYSRPWYAFTAAYDVLLQRGALTVPNGSSLAVTVDDISGKTPKHNDYKELLADHHAALRARGSRLQPQISFACLDSPVRFVLSQHSDLIQAADLVSYCVHRQFRDHGDDWERPPTGPDRRLPMYPHFERIAGKFVRSGNGRVQGYGIVKFPLLNQIRWRVAEP
jgi:hypothetical protein